MRSSWCKYSPLRQCKTEVIKARLTRVKLDARVVYDTLLRFDSEFDSLRQIKLQSKQIILK